ncbi:MAG: FAD:protein FMN transferase, partial [Clostridium sp.]|nr:FAD:protein FMN transferase [Clostridium sp.]
LMGILEVADQAVITSGAYERYFQGEDGSLYHHILDPETGMPADSGLISVTIVSNSGMLADGLSTACYVMGLEDAADYWAENRDFEAIFIEENGAVTITAGLEDSFVLADGYTDREVTVLE